MNTTHDVFDSPTTWIRPHYTAFDGLRGLAMLAVFLMHYGALVLPWQSNYPPLWAGVDMFFVLSGFLITGILLDAREDRHFFKNFYGRRALRIFPLFYGFFLLMLLLSPVLHLRADHYILSTVLYFSNLSVKGYLLGHHGNPTLIWMGRWRQPLMLGNLWSLCVEEQYYMVWPFVVFLIRRRRTLLYLSAGGAVGVLLLRMFLFAHSSKIELDTRFLYCTTWTRCDALLIGSAFAVWLRQASLSRRALHRLARWLIAGSLGALALGFAIFGRHYCLTEVNPVFTTYGYTANAVCAAGLLLYSLDEGGLPARLLRVRWLAALGRLSYGMYFFHGIPLGALRVYTEQTLRPHHLQWLVLPMAFAGTWAMAALSFRFWESPFLRLKSLFRPVYEAAPVQAQLPSTTPAVWWRRGHVKTAA